MNPAPPVTSVFMTYQSSCVERPFAKSTMRAGVYFRQRLDGLCEQLREPLRAVGPAVRAGELAPERDEPRIACLLGASRDGLGEVLRRVGEGDELGLEPAHGRKRGRDHWAAGGERLERLHRKAPAVELARAIGDEADVDDLHVRRQLVERLAADPADVGTAREPVEALGLESWGLRTD